MAEETPPGGTFRDRALKRAVPRPVASYRPPPRELAPGLWVVERRLRHFGVAILPSWSPIVRLGDRSLVVISPPPVLDAGTAGAIGRIGRVAFGVIPNTFHHLYASEFAKRYPDASLLAAPGIRARVPELEIDAELGPQPPASWAGHLEYLVLRPEPRVSEAIFFHAPTASLLLTDLAFNMLRYPRAIDRVVWRASGIPRGFGPGRTTRSFLLSDPALAGRVLARALDWPFTRIVVAHGDVVEHDARARFQRAFSSCLDIGPRRARP